MTKEIRPLQRYNANTEQTEIFYPATTTDAIAHPTKRKSLTNVISDIEEAYAKQTGYYETLGAGTATNLRGVNPTEGTFTFRTSGGSADVATGTAYLERIKGNTVKWNQLLRANKLVDMGLPSGTLWATCDLDVTKADKFCETPFTYEKSFFSWGNIDGHNPISNNAFDYDFGGVNSEEPWYDGQVYGETQGNTLTSNIPQNANYDAARHHLCASWRMPTSAEFVELFANTKFINADGTEIDVSVTNKRVIVDGIRGIYLESNINGARLFFSCSGNGYGRSWNNRGGVGFYWSSTLYTARNARSLVCSSGTNPQDNSNRYNGFPIRPVTNSAIVTDENGHKYAVSGKYIIDLTLMYGEGNEPSTIAQFEADYYKWFGKPLTSEGYTEGELRDVKMSAIKTIGFNQWDEEWRNGIYSFSDGTFTPNNVQICSKNFIQVLPNATYFFKNSEYMWACGYDADKKYVGGLNSNSSFGNTAITIPQNVHYIRFWCRPNYGTTYIHDICINISNAKRNGEYEPHWAETKNVPITTLTGKLNGEGESIIVFPDGLKSAGSVHDEILIENGKAYAIKRVGSVDLGTLTWRYNNYSGWGQGGYAFKGNLSNAKNLSLNEKENQINSKYRQVAYDNSIYTGREDKCIYLRRQAAYGGMPTIRDTSYTDAATFKAAMQGVMLNYELATPLVYELDNFQLPLPYRVDDYGTEEVLGAEKSVAPTLDIRYGINAGDTITNLPKNYISAESIDQLLATMSSVMGGTWTKTWDAANGRYTFSFTQAATLNLAPAPEPEPEEES